MDEMAIPLARRALKAPSSGAQRHARHLGHADAVRSNGDQIREGAADLDAHAHEAISLLRV